MTSDPQSRTSSPTRFIVLATQRTGSTWLVDMLDSHPAIAAYEELFLPPEAHHETWGHGDREFFYAYYARRAGRRWPLNRLFWSLRYTDEVFSPTFATDAIGFKLMYGQLRAFPWLLAYVVLRRIRVVHLVRTNLLDLVLSRETAEARRQYHALASDTINQSVVQLQADQLVSELERLEQSVNRMRSLLSGLPVPRLEVSYEELAVDEGALARVLRFLNVAPRPLTSRLTKLNSDTRQELIGNYEEVERALLGTRFEQFLVQ